jgi:nitrite reductase (NADH) small subunit
MSFVRAARKDEIPAGGVREFQVEGKTLAIANVDGKFLAIDNTCLHRGGPLAQGTLSGKTITCPWHGWQYDMATGKLLQNPAASVACYVLEVRGEDIWADVG